jgi:hypothetical protein
MMLLGDKKEIILLIKPSRSPVYRLCCIGRKRHYRKDGSCKHTEDLLARMNPWHRARTILDGFGGKS